MKKVVEKKKNRIGPKPSVDTVQVFNIFNSQEPLMTYDIFCKMKKINKSFDQHKLSAILCNLHRIGLLKRVRRGVYRRVLKIPKKYVGKYGLQSK
jgi:hypothetical protein